MRKIWVSSFKGIVIAFASLLLIGFCSLFIVLHTDPEYRAMVNFGKDFEQVTIGMEREDVEGRLGLPDRSGNEFRLGQRDGFEDAYQRAVQSGATYYLFWYRWVDRTFTIGFDANDRVVVAESGGT